MREENAIVVTSLEIKRGWHSVNKLVSLLVEHYNSSIMTEEKVESTATEMGAYRTFNYSVSPLPPRQGLASCLSLPSSCDYGQIFPAELVQYS